MIQAHRWAALAGASLMMIAATAATPALKGNPESSDLPASLDESMRSPVLDVLGTSGNLRALIATPDSLARSTALRPLLAGRMVEAPGIHALGLPAPDGDSLVVVLLESFGTLKGAKLGDYRVGRWPVAGPASGDPRYAPPADFIPVHAEHQHTAVSKRFRLRDFLTHDQQDVWPKVLVLRPALLDKLELIGDELERRGLPGALRVMSGFRTPQYNARGVGAKGGRAGASRHMYGDAADVFVDGNGDGRMDDLDGDGKSTIRDAQLLFAVAEEVESRHPELIGGLSAYPSNSAHGPFVHVDARGVRARW